MIIFKKNEDIFKSTARYLVNPVNTKGVMGKGLALEFQKRFKKNFDEYKAFCQESSRKGGDLFWYEPEAEDILRGDRAIINLFTKEDWKNPSRLEWINTGLINILEQVASFYTDGNYFAPLIALPLVGCGQGKLNEEEVIELIKKVFKDCLFDIEVYL